MNNKLIKVITCIAIITVFSMSISTSYANYHTKMEYSIDITSNSFEKLLTSSDNGKAVTLEQEGYYAIVLKGGDGGDGAEQGDNKTNLYIPGGSGGVIATVAKFNANTKLVPYIGNGVTAKSSFNGTAINGANNTNFGSGGDGNTFAISSSGGFVKAVIEWLSSYFTATNSGTGGGAASELYVSSVSNSNLLVIAGGGGGSGSCAYSYNYPEGYSVTFMTVKTSPAGTGGEGGSNVLGTKTTPINTGSGSGNNTSAPAGYAFSGIDGNDFSNTSSLGLSDGSYKNTYLSIHAGNYTSSKPSYGLGGSTSGGVGGYVVANTYESASQADSGGNFAAKGKGGNAKQYGGGGGGGFCGGGGGNSASIDYSNGGGGGGSSYYAETVPGTSNRVMSMPKELFDELIVHAKFTVDINEDKPVTPTIITKITGSKYTGWKYTTSSGSPWVFYHIKKDNAVYKNGFAYILYLGPDDQATLDMINSYNP